MTTLNPVDKDFFIKRKFNWILLGLTYAFFYMSRYNFASGHSTIAEVFGWTYTDYSSILSGALLVYGLSVFLNGPLCDKIGGRLSILIGSIGACVFNLLFGLFYLCVGRSAIIDKATHSIITPAVLNYSLSMTTLITMLTAVWMSNHYFQSFGALSIVKINTAWFKVSERGRLAGLFSICIQFGRFLGTFVCSLLVAILPWQYIFWIPACLLGCVTLLNWKYLKDSPEELGYKYFDTPTIKREDVQIRLVLRKVFANRAMWLFAVIAMCLGITRNSIEHWYARYFQVMYNIKATDTILYLPYKIVAISVPILMVLVGFLSGWLSDTKFNSRRGPIVLFSFILQGFFLITLTLFIHSPWGAALSIIFLLASMQAGHCLVAATASMDFGGRKAAATATGFIDGMQYLAGAIVMFGMGRILDASKITNQIGHEFTIWPLIPLPMAFIGMILSIFLWNVKASSEEKEH